MNKRGLGLDWLHECMYNLLDIEMFFYLKEGDSDCRALLAVLKGLCERLCEIDFMI